jgi:hypothetical protein
MEVSVSLSIRATLLYVIFPEESRLAQRDTDASRILIISGVTGERRIRPSQAHCHNHSPALPE